MTTRSAWIEYIRRNNETRMDTLFAPIYDSRWGASSDPSHVAMLTLLTNHLSGNSLILDAACGSGKYWPWLVERGMQLEGIDQSRSMLDLARTKVSNIPVRHMGLQELADRSRFHAVICIDALENVAPEDWPLVLANFRRALLPNGWLYLTVEEPEFDYDEVHRQAVGAGLPLLPGEYVKDGGYHFYPTDQRVLSWLDDQGFQVHERATGDGYWHYLVQ